MTTLTDNERRAEVLRLASNGVPLVLIHRLCASLDTRTLTKFRRAYKTELERGAALADALVMESLHELATSGKSVQATLAWAKERLGWSAEGERNTDDRHSAAATQNALSLLQTLLDEIARSKAGGLASAIELAVHCPPQSVTAAGG